MARNLKVFLLVSMLPEDRSTALPFVVLRHASEENIETSFRASQHKWERLNGNVSVSMSSTEKFTKRAALFGT